MSHRHPHTHPHNHPAHLPLAGGRAAPSLMQMSVAARLTGAILIIALIWLGVIGVLL